MKLYKNFNPLVSVIIPTFNRENYLQRAIASIIAQDVDYWELIVADDGSPDGTFDIVMDFQNEYQNIRYIRHQNQCLPQNMNSGIALSSGKYLAFCGDDDEFKPEHIRLRTEYMEANPEVDFIHGGLEVIGEPYVKDKNNLNKQIHLSECVVGGTFFGKRNAFLKLDGYADVRYSEDSEFYNRALKLLNVQKVDWPTYIYYRTTPDSICTTITDKK